MATQVAPTPVTTEHKRAVRIREQLPYVGTIEEMAALVADPAQAGRSFEVGQEVFAHYTAKLRLLPQRPDDVDRVNAMLGINLSPDTTLAMTGEVTCPACSHRFSFADHLAAVLGMGTHVQEHLARLLSSDRYVLTVASHTPREMMCPQCGTTSLFARYCYQAAGYAYAIEGQ
jgi:uncharacterized Zn-finger protein